MAKRSLSTTTLTPVAVADTVAYTNSTGYCGTIFGGASTQINQVSEIYCGGQATSSAPTFMVFARDSTVPITLVAGATFDAPLHAATGALAVPAVVGNSAGTPAQRSATGHLLNLSYNAFGGVVRWVAPPGAELVMVGTAVSLGSASLSAFTGGTPGLMGSHIIYETL